MMDPGLLQSRHFCMMPWVHLHLWPDGQAFPCCIADTAKPLGRYGDESLREIWNGEPQRRLRLAMLRDEPSPECERCYTLERNSPTYTLRRMANEHLSRNHWPLVESTRADGSVDEMRMAYLDVRFSNLCNFRCHTCGPGLSSAWAVDQERAFGIAGPRVVEISPSERFFAELLPLLDGVEMAYFAGGEPLMCAEHYRILDHWIARGRTDVRINYTTNFSTLDADGRRILDYWRKFRHVSVSASLDASHARGEYLRKGTVWSHIVENRRRLQAELPALEFELTPTISAFNALHFPDFHREWVELGLVRPNQLRLNMLTHPPEMSVQVLPDALKAQIREKYQRVRDELTAECRRAGEPSHNVEQGYDSVLGFLALPSLTQLIPQLLERLRKLDRVRGDDLFTAFPELAPLGDYDRLAS